MTEVRSRVQLEACTESSWKPAQSPAGSLHKSRVVEQGMHEELLAEAQRRRRLCPALWHDVGGSLQSRLPTPIVIRCHQGSHGSGEAVAGVLANKPP
jgi:hypothetical protein